MAKKQFVPTWYSDNKAEADLKLLAIAFEVRKIPFSKLDMKESQVNGARLGDAILEHKVEDYMQGMLNGDTFPRPVVYKSPTGYVILGGNQRCESVRRLIKEGWVPASVEIEVYVVDTTDKFLLEIIARSGNVAHGAGADKTERMHHAVYSVRSLGMRPKDAAVIYRVSENGINANIRAEDQRRKLAMSGVDASRVANAAIEPLGKLDFDASAQRQLGSLIVQHQPSAERVRQVVASVSKQTSGSARVAKVKEFEKELAAAAHESNGNGKVPHVEHSRVPLRPRRDKAMRLMTHLLNFLEAGNDGEAFTSTSELQCASDADKRRMVELCNKLSYRLRVLAR